MVGDGLCFLSDSKAWIETVPGQGGQRFGVLCSGDCPRYEISRLAINYLPKHPIHRNAAIQSIKQVAASGDFPVIRVAGIPHQLYCTSREDELKDKT